MIKKLLNMVIYTDGGIFSKENKYINLHLIISEFIVYAVIASIFTETQVQVVLYLDGDSTLLKLSNMIGLGFSLIANAIMTKNKTIVIFRKYYVLLSALSTFLLVLINAIIVIDDYLILRFIGTTVVNNSIVTILGNTVSDTINNKFTGTERTIYSSKKNCMSILASFIGVIGAFFIKADLNILLIIEAIIYIIMMLDDLFIFQKFKEQVFLNKESIK
nr:MAG TPA: hypothetical protein [Caudoviricetes sp.]